MRATMQRRSRSYGKGNFNSTLGEFFLQFPVHLAAFPSPFPAKYASDSPFTSGPFLRRQESHFNRRRCRPWLRDSCFRRNGLVGEWGIVGGFGIVVAAIVAGGLSSWRFLLSQEWSVGDGSVSADFGIIGNT